MSPSIHSTPIRLSTRIAARLVCGVVAFVALWALSSTALFVASVVAQEKTEACPRDLTEPGINIDVSMDGRSWRGNPFYGIETGGYHGYAGPGGLFLRVGLGFVVVQLESPNCS